MTSFKVGDRVVRKDSRSRIAGAVVVVGVDKVRVAWDKSQGCTLKTQSSAIKTSSLVLESEFKSRPLSGPTADANRKSRWNVATDWHSSGTRCGEYGVNVWWLSSEEEAREKFAEVVAAHPDHTATMKRQDEITWVPDGCRRERIKYEWHTLASHLPNPTAVVPVDVTYRTVPSVA